MGFMLVYSLVFCGYVGCRRSWLVVVYVWCVNSVVHSHFVVRCLFTGRLIV